LPLSSLSELAAGKTTRFDAKTIIKLCRYFNIGVGDLLVIETVEDWLARRAATAGTNTAHRAGKHCLALPVAAGT
jgi:hypothetical protein